jgi:predicted alpha/beta-fold hydrolase
MERRNIVYERVFVHEMKAAYGRLDLLTPEMRANLGKARTILAVDDAATAPLHGYPDAATYYDATAGVRMIPQIRCPLLLIHAEDDPWIPPEPYYALRDDAPATVSLTLTPKGGHVGYHGTHGAEPWHDLRIDAYLRGLGGLGG